MTSNAATTTGPEQEKLIAAMEAVLAHIGARLGVAQTSFDALVASVAATAAASADLVAPAVFTPASPGTAAAAAAASAGGAAGPHDAMLAKACLLEGRLRGFSLAVDGNACGIEAERRLKELREERQRKADVLAKLKDIEKKASAKLIEEQELLEQRNKESALRDSSCKRIEEASSILQEFESSYPESTTPRLDITPPSITAPPATQQHTTPPIQHTTPRLSITPTPEPTTVSPQTSPRSSHIQHSHSVLMDPSEKMGIFQALNIEPKSPATKPKSKLFSHKKV
ncbi:hypothetical protein Pelo_11099 [Pelomyxa schiedti]|nr:hypothetical protein Pelo_11099 [Pelomyxa schiedti]